MTDDANPQSVACLKPRPHQFEARVRFLAENTSFVSWSKHALERMEERGISTRVALTVLREGHVVGEIEAGTSTGEWKGKIVRNVKGRRDVGVIVLIIRNDRLFVKTAEWEDVR